jgi:Mg/Co/Ni transporter MgtE
VDRAEGNRTQEIAECLADLKAAWPVLSAQERIDGLKLLPEDEAEEVFLELGAREQAQLLLALPAMTRRTWLRLLPLDEAADVVQQAPAESREELMKLLDDVSLKEVRALLAYAEDEAGGLMNPRFVRLRPEMTIDEAILYLRRQALQKDRPIYYNYVLDPDRSCAASAASGSSSPRRPTRGSSRSWWATWSRSPRTSTRRRSRRSSPRTASSRCRSSTRRAG